MTSRPGLGPPLAPGTPATDTYGTAHPTFLRAFDRSTSRWMALCQARKDTDGDGKVEVGVGHHGGLFGDAMQLYLVIGGGDGTVIDALVDSSLDDRWVATVRGASLELVDTSTRAVFVLKDADIESDNRPGTSHRAARFATGSLLYVRHRDANDVVVIHDLTSHIEREVQIADRVWRFARADQFAEVYTVPRSDAFPRLNTTLDAGECTGPAMSSSSYGQDGPKPTKRLVDVAKGVEITSLPSPITDAVEPTPVRMPDIPDDGTGPARWN